MNLISEDVFKEIKSLDDFLNKMNTTIDGDCSFEITDKNEFLNKLESFKDYLNIHLTDFSIDEILKIYQNRKFLNDIYTWFDIENLMRVIEYEQRSIHLSALTNEELY